MHYMLATQENGLQNLRRDTITYENTSSLLATQAFQRNSLRREHNTTEYR